MAKKATINMVAELAGVSRGTVDRVLNQRPHVKPEVRERVLRAMKELRYIPPHEEQAEALGLESDDSRPPRKLGVLLSSETGYFFSEVMHGVRDAQDILRTSNVEILVEKCESGVPYEYIERLERLESQKISGLAVCAKNNVNITDVTQSVQQDVFAMIMMADISGCSVEFSDFVDQMTLLGEQTGMTIYVTHEDLFNSMHRI